jgi:formylmethanofuran dehydrogenase subunit E
MDYGIMAATFLNLETRKAFRILSTEEARELVPLYAPGISEKSIQQLEAYQRMPDSVLFRVQEVEVPLQQHDLPGPASRKIACTRCGQIIRDHREVEVDGVPLCKPCAQGAYFNNAREITWEDMNWAPEPEQAREDATFPRVYQSREHPQIALQHRKGSEESAETTRLERAASL